MANEELIEKAIIFLGEYNNLKNKFFNDKTPKKEKLKVAILMKRVNIALSVLNEKEKQLMKNRYIEKMDWPDIARAMGYKSENRKSMQTICAKSLEKVADVLFPSEDYIC